MSRVAPALATYRQLVPEILRAWRGSDAHKRMTALARELAEQRATPGRIIKNHLAVEREILTPDLAALDEALTAAAACSLLIQVMIAYSLAREEAFAEQRALMEETNRQARHQLSTLETIAHDVRTPLTSASADIDLAARLLARGELSDVSTAITSARVTMAHVKALVSTYLAAAPGQAAPLHVTHQPVEDIVRLALHWVEPVAAEKHLTLQASYPAHATIVACDADALLITLENLLTNAIRYTAPGGRVSIRVRPLVKYGCIDVIDSGIGMNARIRRRIFQRSFRAPEARWMAGQGLGLGLTTARQLIEAQHGRLEVRSAPGEGSTFRVKVPLAEPRLRRTVA